MILCFRLNGKSQLAKLERQQESLSSLTDAIHGLVKVLANPPHPSSTNLHHHEDAPGKSDRSSALVQSQPLAQSHHDKHQLGIYHNQKGKNSTKIESVIS